MITSQTTSTVWYDKILHFILSCLVFIASVSLIALILITCIDVVGRYILNAPLMGSTELTEITLAVTVFTSLPIVSYTKKHIVVDLLVGFMPKILIRFIDIVSYFLIAFMMYQISLHSEKLITRAFRRESVTEYLEIPTAYLIVYAQFMGYLTAVLMIVLILKNILGGETYDD